MKRDEIIRKAKSAKTPEELCKIVKSSGIGDITEETAGKLFDRLSSSHEIADEELDVSAGGCLAFDNVVCTKCHQAAGFEVLNRDDAAGTCTVKCEGCGNVSTIPLADVGGNLKAI